MHHMNMSFVMKLAWGVMFESDSVWVKVLRGKYIKSNERVLQVNAKQRDSSLQKIISDVQNQVTKELCWSVNDGACVKFWRDGWLDIYKPFINHVRQEIPQDLREATVLDMVGRTNNGDESVFFICYPYKQQVIANYPSSNNMLGKYNMYWRGSPNGSFRVYSTYSLQNYELKNQNYKDPLWKLIQRWKGMEIIRNFLWIVGHNATLMNAKRYK